MTPEKYLKKLQQSDSKKEIEQTCKELENWLNLHDHLAIRTKLNKLAKYNKIIKTIRDDDLILDKNAFLDKDRKRHLHFYFFKIHEINFDELNKKTTTIKLSNRIPIDAKAYKKITVALLKSQDITDNIVGLIAASGRRPIEIIYLGYFELIKNKLMFHGQAKKREKLITYKIDVIAPTKLFLEVFTKVRITSKVQEQAKAYYDREMTDEEVNLHISALYNRSINQRIRAAFKEFQPRHEEKSISAKYLRAAYAKIATHMFCPEDTEPLLYASKILGHFDAEDGNLMPLLTTLGYFDMYIL